MPRKSKVNKTSNIVNEISSFVSKAERKSNDNSDSDLSDDEINIYLSSIDKRTRNSDVERQELGSPLGADGVETEPIQKIKRTYKKKPQPLQRVGTAVKELLTGGDANDNHFKLFEQYRSELENMKTEISTLKNQKKSEPKTQSVQEVRPKTDNEMRRELMKLRFT